MDVVPMSTGGSGLEARAMWMLVHTHSVHADFACLTMLASLLVFAGGRCWV